jgi:hypothetical protein
MAEIPSPREIDVPQILKTRRDTLAAALLGISRVANGTYGHPDVTFLAAMISHQSLLEACKQQTPSYDPQTFQQHLQKMLKIIKVLEQRRLTKVQTNMLTDAKEEIVKILQFIIEGKQTREIPILERYEQTEQLAVAEKIPMQVRENINIAALGIATLLATDILPSVSERNKEVVRRYMQVFGELATLALTIEEKSALLVALGQRRQAMGTIIGNFSNPDARESLRSARTSLDNIYTELE